MTRTARQIRLLADALDQQGKADSPIAVIGTRGHLRREFKPAERGGGAARRIARTAADPARAERCAAKHGLG